MLRIGAFSHLARVTVKTLRHYDDVGLFRPAYVSPTSGYRYYRADQLAALQRVRVYDYDTELQIPITRV